MLEDLLDESSEILSIESLVNKCFQESGIFMGANEFGSAPGPQISSYATARSILNLFNFSNF